MNTNYWQDVTVDSPMNQRRKAMRENKDALVSNNYWDLLHTNRGWYLLMRHGKIEGLFAEPYDAVESGLAMFPNDYDYSIEKIESEAVFMGMSIGLVAHSEK